MIVKVDGLVWLPKDDLNYQNIINIKDQLTIYPRKTTDIGSKADPPPIFLFEEKADYLGVPRGWYLKNVTIAHEEILNVSYGEKMRDLKTRYRADGHFAEQEDVLRLFFEQMEGRKWGGFLLQAGCGWGKSSAALELARRIGRKTLILVHKEFFLEQWKDQINYLMPDARVGIIRQNKCEYEGNDFVIGMLQSLARDEGKKYISDIYSSFGTVVSDECHRVSSQTWSGIIPRFKAAWKIGLTATPRRKDGSQDVFFFHISDISYRADTKPQVPKLRVLRTQSQLKPIIRGTWRVDISNLNSAQILTQLGADEFRAKDIVDQLVLAVKSGRKIMVVSERISHLKMMSDMLGESLFDMELPFVPIIDFYTGEWYSGEVWEKSTKSHKKGSPKLVKRTKADLKKAESANVIFCTRQLAEEGLDIPALDVLVLSLPMSDVEQVVGRCRRWCVADHEKCKRLCPWRSGDCNEKPIPIVMDVIDDIDKLRPKWERRKRFYRSIGTLKTGE